MNDEFDSEVIIVGAGPAGLSAALVLGRCLRNVIICDSGKQRNLYSNALHSYLTRDGVSPSAFLEISHKELEKYETIRFIKTEVKKALILPNGFEVILEDGKILKTKKLLLATGVIDDVPQIEGIMDFYGKSVHICPYCDAWENKGSPIAVYGKGKRGFKFTLNMLNWTKDIVLCTDGPCELDSHEIHILEKNYVGIRQEKITALKGDKGQLESIFFADGTSLPREALFFNTESFIRSELLEQLGCPFTQEEGVSSQKYERTQVPGLYVAGNICRQVQLVIIAAAEGAEAAIGINTDLTQESFNF